MGRAGKYIEKFISLCSVLQSPCISVPETQRLFNFRNMNVPELDFAWSM